MPTWKRLTSTSGSKIDVNMDATAYISPGQHGSTVYFLVADAGGKLVSLSIKETMDGVHAAMSPSAGSAEPAHSPPA
jgi:hypothetical protein